MKISYILISTLVMAITTYLIRLIPIALFRKKITNRWVRSFLYYVPYTVLAAMTFPAVFWSTGSVIASVVGCIVALFLAYLKRGLLTVAIGASLAALITQIIN